MTSQRFQKGTDDISSLSYWKKLTLKLVKEVVRGLADYLSVERAQQRVVLPHRGCFKQALTTLQVCFTDARKNMLVQYAIKVYGVGYANKLYCIEKSSLQRFTVAITVHAIQPRDRQTEGQKAESQWYGWVWNLQNVPRGDCHYSTELLMHRFFSSMAL